MTSRIFSHESILWLFLSCVLFQLLVTQPTRAVFNSGSKIVGPSYGNKQKPQLMSIEPAGRTSLTSFRFHLHRYRTINASLDICFIQLSTAHIVHSSTGKVDFRREYYHHTHINMRLAHAAIWSQQLNRRAIHEKSVESVWRILSSRREDAQTRATSQTVTWWPATSRQTNRNSTLL